MARQLLFAGRHGLRCRFRLCRGGRRGGGGENAAERLHAEKAVPAGIASIRRKTKPTLECDHRASFHAFARDVLQVEVSAARAVRVQRECRGHFPGVKPQLARHAAPRSRAGEARDKIGDAASMRSVAFSASAARTDHCLFDASAPKARTLKLRSISKTAQAGKFAPKCPAMPPRVITATTRHSG